MKTRQLFFVALGLVFIASGLFVGRSLTAHAHLKNGQKFEDWQVVCAKDANKKELCFLTQTVNITQDSQQKTIAMYQIGYIGDVKELKMVQTLPLGMLLAPGTTIIADNKQMIAPGKFNVCTAAGCSAVTDLDDATVKSLVEAKELALGFMGGDGKQVNLIISTKGLKEGLEALRKK